MHPICVFALGRCPYPAALGPAALFVVGELSPAGGTSALGAAPPYFGLGFPDWDVSQAPWPVAPDPPSKARGYGPGALLPLAVVIDVERS